MTFDLRNRSLVQSTNELITMVNRVNFLQREKDKIESYNLRTLQKTNQIHQIKEDYRSQALSPAQAKLQNDQRIENQMQLRKSYLNQSKLAVSRMQSERVEEIRQRKEHEKILLDEAKQEVFKRKQEIYDQVKQSKMQSKQQVQEFWSKKIDSVHQQKYNEQFVKNQRCKLQDRSIEKLEQLETDLIQNLKQSQQLTRVLDKQLDDVLHLRHEEFKKIYPRESQQKPKRNYSNIRSKVMQDQLYNKFEDVKLPAIESQRALNSTRICGVNASQEYRNRIMKIYSNHKDLAIFYRNGRTKVQCFTERNSRHQSKQQIKVTGDQFREANQFNKRQLISDVTHNSRFYSHSHNLSSFENQKLSENNTTEKSLVRVNQPRGLTQEFDQQGEIINVQSSEQLQDNISNKETLENNQTEINEQMREQPIEKEDHENQLLPQDIHEVSFKNEQSQQTQNDVHQNDEVEQNDQLSQNQQIDQGLEQQTQQPERNKIQEEQKLDANTNNQDIDQHAHINKKDEIEQDPIEEQEKLSE